MCKIDHIFENISQYSSVLVEISWVSANFNVSLKISLGTPHWPVNTSQYLWRLCGGSGVFRKELVGSTGTPIHYV